MGCWRIGSTGTEYRRKRPKFEENGLNLTGHLNPPVTEQTGTESYRNDSNREIVTRHFEAQSEPRVVERGAPVGFSVVGGRLRHTTRTCFSMVRVPGGVPMLRRRGYIAAAPCFVWWAVA